ncbi:MAG: hypothetical protein K1X68_02750 [Saprospiraceae bacterium]|nr:hypothetical protein [Saprospiraceae bacterium]HMW39158.1 hypothetical protein [Saprospiraceae bacterium]HMX88741.1 hypothetical protein [Saprospiraceae bacterium]HMZ38873.1 hypothetical protein [Saprospiraceae bacterium]HNA64497.1 hypothetical protein [Saprospiraceae bacterium]
MKKFLIFLAINCFVFLFSCDNCSHFRLLPFECFGPGFINTFYLKVVDQRTGKDLLFGTSPRYDYRSLKLSGLSDTLTFCDLFSSGICGLTLVSRGLDSLIEVYIPYGPNPNNYILKLSDTDSENLAFYFREHNDDCCRKITELTYIQHNNDPRRDLRDSIIYVLRR